MGKNFVILLINKKISFSKYEQFDLKNISNIMKEVNNLLWGVDSWIDYYISMSNSLISLIPEYEEDYESLYYY